MRTILILLALVLPLRADVLVMGFGAKGTVAVYALSSPAGSAADVVMKMWYSPKPAKDLAHPGFYLLQPGAALDGWYHNTNGTIYRYGYAEDNYLFKLWCPATIYPVAP